MENDSWERNLFSVQGLQEREGACGFDDCDRTIASV